MKKFVLAFFLLSLALQIGYILWFPHEPMESDSTQYHAIAVNVGAGRGYAIEPGVPTARRSPGYPLFLAAIYAVSGGSLVAVELAQAALGAMTCLLTFLIARELFGNAAAKPALALAATYLPLIAYSGKILTETLFTFLLAAAVLCFVRAMSRDRWTLYAASGFFLGLATMTRPDTILLPALLLPALLVGLTDWKKALLRFAVLAVFSAVSLVPWTVRNYRCFHQLFPGSSGGLGALVWGSAQYAARDALDGNYRAWRDIRDVYDRTYGTATPEQTERAMLREGMRMIRKHPSRFALLVARRIPKYWITSHSALFGIGLPNAEYVRRGEYGTLAAKTAMLMMHMSILVLCALGVWLSRKRLARVIVPLALILYASSYVFLDIANRHHVPFMPYLIVFAAAALSAVTARRTPDARREGLCAE